MHLERLDRGGCRRCGEPTAADGACAFDHRVLTGLAFARAPFRYRGTGGALVRRLKLGGDFGALSVLALSMAEAIAPRLVPSWRRAVVVPVPLHRSRRRARGFDQAELLAEAVAHRLLLRCEPGCLHRRRATRPQGDPQVVSRTQNVDGAFAVVRGAAVRGERVLLVDDVATSFATARACAAELIEAGAREVALLTSCRARSPMASL